jgi:hypothetical protein
LPSGRDHQIQIFHGHGTKQDIVTKHQRTDKAGTIFESNFHGADIVTDMTLAVGRCNLALLHSLKTKLQNDVLRQT